MTASDINEEISFWIHLGGVSLITIFGEGTSTLNMGSIFQWQQRKKKKKQSFRWNLCSCFITITSHLAGKFIYSVSPTALFSLATPEFSSIEVPNMKWNQWLSGNLHHHAEKEYWGNQPHGLSRYPVLSFFIVSRAVVGQRSCIKSATLMNPFLVCIYSISCVHVWDLASTEGVTAK